MRSVVYLYLFLFVFRFKIAFCGSVAFCRFMGQEVGYMTSPKHNLLDNYAKESF